MSNFNNNKWKLLLPVLAMLGASTSAMAIPTNTLESDGVVWTLTGDAIPGVSTMGSFMLTADATGWSGGVAYLAEFSLKNFGSGATLSNLVAPAGSTWSWLNEGLEAKGCKSNGTADALCVSKTSAFDTSPMSGEVFSFMFDISLTDVFPDYTHLKVRWLDADGKKVGDLISQDISWKNGEVPEPSVLALLGFGLVGIAVSRRRVKK